MRLTDWWALITFGLGVGYVVFIISDFVRDTLRTNRTVKAILKKNNEQKKQATSQQS